MKKNQKKKSYKFNLYNFICLCVGFLLGIIVYFLIVNWNGFFATCPSGQRPDKNGCCEHELYTDAGDGWMVCCPEVGGDCFPPVK